MTTQEINGRGESSKLYDRFDVKAYLNARYGFGKNPDMFRVLFPLEQYHKFYEPLPEGLKILEYGSGPVPAFLISAAPHASEIIMAEFAEVNRKAIQQWVDKDSTAFDWSPHFDHVVQKLEGKGEEEARKREEQVRKAIKAVVFCDVNEEGLIEKGYEGPYDVIVSNACIDVGCESPEQYVAVVRKLSSFLKPGGRMGLSSVYFKPDLLGKHFAYPVGSERFPFMAVTTDFIKTALEDAGFSNVTMECCERDNTLSEAASTPRDAQDARGLWRGVAFVTASMIKEEY